MTDESEDFASRWSRLKRQKAAQDGQKAPEPDRPQDTTAMPAAEDRPDEEILKELGLPDPDSLKPGDDFSAFLAAAVPARLRNRALRRLWGSRPVFANLDRLVDYDEDYTDAATVPDVLRSAYRVGRGWLEGENAEQPTQPEEPAPERPQPEAPAHGEAKQAGPESADAEPAREPGASGAGAAGEAAADAERQVAAAAVARRAAVPAGTRPRMRFRFTDE